MNSRLQNVYITHSEYGDKGSSLILRPKLTLSQTLPRATKVDHPALLLFVPLCYLKYLAPPLRTIHRTYLLIPTVRLRLRVAPRLLSQLRKSLQDVRVLAALRLGLDPLVLAKLSIIATAAPVATDPQVGRALVVRLEMHQDIHGVRGPSPRRFLKHWAHESNEHSWCGKSVRLPDKKTASSEQQGSARRSSMRSIAHQMLRTAAGRPEFSDNYGLCFQQRRSANPGAGLSSL